MTDYKEYEDVATEDYIVVKALSEGVQVIGLTRGGETRSHLSLIHISEPTRPY